MSGTESTPFREFWGEGFKGKVLPLGCGVWFLPAPTKYENSKSAPTMSFGIFLGYNLTPGGNWGDHGRGLYRVADLTDFVGRCLGNEEAGTTYRIWPHNT